MTHSDTRAREPRADVRSVLRHGGPLLAGWALVLLLWKTGAPLWVSGLVVLAQALWIVVGSLGLWSTRSARFGLLLTLVFLLSVVLLPLLAVETSLHEADPVWRLPEAAAAEEP